MLRPQSLGAGLKVPSKKGHEIEGNTSKIPSFVFSPFSPETVPHPINSSKPNVFSKRGGGSKAEK